MARSSANCEDQAAVSGAGLYESVANTPVAELGAAVRQVWASLWTRAAALSRRQAGIPAPQVHMAVLVQPFLVPDYSFVLHTVHPVQEAPHQAYAEVAVGAGESLVSAAARGNPFRFLCDKQTGAVTTLAFASFSHALRPAADRGLQPETVDYSQVALSCRVDARERLGRRLAATARLVESAFRSPQDIEGAVVGDEIWLVQARVQPGASGGLAS
jgi:phosphoglucan,water dikinase